MNKNFLTILCVALAWGFIGCGKKAGPSTQLDETVEAVKQAETAVPAQPTVPTTTGVQSAPAQQLEQALIAYKAGSYEDAVARLQKLRAQPTASPQQAVAIQDAVAGVMGELYALAAKGDKRAQQAIDQYQRLQGH